MYCTNLSVIVNEFGKQTIHIKTLLLTSLQSAAFRSTHTSTTAMSGQGRAVWPIEFMNLGKAS